MLSANSDKRDICRPADVTLSKASLCRHLTASSLGKALQISDDRRLATASCCFEATATDQKSARHEYCWLHSCKGIVEAHHSLRQRGQAWRSTLAFLQQTLVSCSAECSTLFCYCCTDRVIPGFTSAQKAACYTMHDSYAIHVQMRALT